jgi:membrane complex biogenesis BtpA family protein
MQGLNNLFTHTQPIIGVVHLLPLIGSPGYRSSFEQVCARARSDAETLVTNGIDGLIIENYGDTPFFPNRVAPHTVASMAIISHQIRQRFPKTPIGLNVLRNDAESGLAIATVVRANFIRINVHTGGMLTDQGIIQGHAHETLRYRSQLKSDVRILADIAVKHATPLAPIDLATTAEDTYHRGLADALIVTGVGTGKSTQHDQLECVKAAVPQASVFAGSGVTANTIAETLEVADGVIVGTALKQDSVASNEVNAERVRAVVSARG